MGSCIAPVLSEIYLPYGDWATEANLKSTTP